MNIFDAIVIALMLIAVVMGYSAGLLRSLATILGYAVAAPFAVLLTPKLAPLLPNQSDFLFFVVFLVTGVVMGALMRSTVHGLVGEDVGVFDRIAGALLGAVRIGLLAVLMVLIFERVIPENLRPPWLTESRLRPYLSLAGQRGLRTLPPDVTEYIDRMKRERGI